MNILFEHTRISSMTLANRFFRAATWEGMATSDGEVSPQLVSLMAELARGEVGCIITGHAYVAKGGQATPWQLAAHDDALLPGLRQLTEAVHMHGTSIVLQLAHAGLLTETQLTGLPLQVVSAPETPNSADIHVLTEADIDQLTDAFAAAARRAKAAGFDGVEIHSAHGYLLSQFLSPAFNRRTDSYGGTMAQRTTVHRQVYQKVREAVGPDFPVLIKMNCADFVDNGLTADDARAAAREFAAIGFDALEISGGIIRTGKLAPSRPGIVKPEQEAYFREYAGQIRSEITVPLILVGGIRSFETAEALVRDGIADYIAMSRPLIREPHLVARWHRGDMRKAACASDNLCFAPGFQGNGITCRLEQLGAGGRCSSESEEFS